MLFTGIGKVLAHENLLPFMLKTHFNIRGNSFGYFSQLSIYDISEKKKIKKSVHRERRTLPNKLFIVGYDAREFVTSSKMAAILTATILKPISR